MGTASVLFSLVVASATCSVSAAFAVSSARTSGGVHFTKKDAERGRQIHRDVLALSSQQGFGNCSIDLRATLPVCTQSGPDWCWATGLTEFSFYLNRSKVSNGDNCTAVECAIVSQDLHTNCCPYRAHRGCGVDGESVADIVKIGTEFIGKQFKSLGQPPTEEHLQNYLMAGHPVMPIILWSKGGGHALFVAGCDMSGVFGSPRYFLHDPEKRIWEKVAYMHLMDYPGLSPGKWTDTVMEAVSVASRVVESVPKCNRDLRPAMPPCRQTTQSWCWATCISVLAAYYNVSEIPSTANCSAVECKVVGSDLGMNCCPSHTVPRCDEHGARSPSEIAATATKFMASSRPDLVFQAIEQPHGPPMKEEELVEALQRGAPVIHGITYAHSEAGHVRVIGGCKSSSFGNEYYVHDPETQSWILESYTNLVSSSGYWTWTSAVVAHA